METSANNRLTSSTVEDRNLRKFLIETAMNIEKMIKDGKVAVGHTFENHLDWGLSIEVETSQPREDKPVVFAFKYRMNRQKFVKWLSDHKYLMAGEVLGFGNSGLTIMVPGPGTDKYHKTSFLIVLRYTDDVDHEISLDLLNDTVEFMVCREVISEHDWMVTTIIE